MARAPRWDRKADGTMSLVASNAAKTILMNVSNVGVFNFGSDAAGVDFKWFGATTGLFMLWDASANALVFDGGAKIVSAAGDHMKIETTDDDKNIRIQSRNYASTSGEFSAIQIKPNITTDGTVTIYGIECSPRFASAAGGNTLVGIRSTPILKGTSGTLTGDVRVYQAELTDENAAGRTIDGVVSMLWCWHQLAGHTFTGGIYVMDLRTAGGGKGWDGFVNVQASGDAGFTTSSDGMFRDPESHTEAGFVTITVAGTDFELPYYASS